MAIGVRVEPELEQRLDRLARALARAAAPAYAKRLRSMWTVSRMAMKPGGSRL